MRFPSFLSYESRFEILEMFNAHFLVSENDSNKILKEILGIGQLSAKKSSLVKLKDKFIFFGISN